MSMNWVDRRYMQDQIAAAVAAEREACAKVADQGQCADRGCCGVEIAAAIRARGAQPAAPPPRELVYAESDPHCPNCVGAGIVRNVATGLDVICPCTRRKH